MATPPTPSELLAILRAEGVHVAEYPGWRTRERDDETGKTFGPIHLVLNHHTGGTNSLRTVAEVGRPDLPPPLAHIHLAKSGLATMCSAGRANHAGLMARNAYDSFANEASTHPKPLASSGTVDGNDVAIGIETENRGDGEDPYTREQYDSWVRINAAICRHFDWSAESCAGHLETSIEGKPDPRGPVEGYGARGKFTFTMRQFRADVAERLKHPANWNPTTEAADMTPEQAKQLKELHDKLAPYMGWNYKGKGTIDAWALLNGLKTQQTALVAQVGALSSALTALAQAGGLDAAEVRAAAEAGAQAALDRLAGALDGDPTT